MVSLARELSLKPQAKSVLSYLKKYGKITPLKADTVLGVSRLAASIYELKQIGYKITTTNKRDEAGHRYGQYALVAQ